VVIVAVGSAVIAVTASSPARAVTPPTTHVGVLMGCPIPSSGLNLDFYVDNTDGYPVRATALVTMKGTSETVLGPDPLQPGEHRQARVVVPNGTSGVSYSTSVAGLGPSAPPGSITSTVPVRPPDCGGSPPPVGPSPPAPPAPPPIAKPGLPESPSAPARVPQPATVGPPPGDPLLAPIPSAPGAPDTTGAPTAEIADAATAGDAPPDKPDILDKPDGGTGDVATAEPVADRRAIPSGLTPAVGLLLLAAIVAGAVTLILRRRSGLATAPATADDAATGSRQRADEP
jgi:hypothetical protein